MNIFRVQPCIRQPEVSESSDCYISQLKRVMDKQRYHNSETKWTLEGTLKTPSISSPRLHSAVRALDGVILTRTIRSSPVSFCVAAVEIVPRSSDGLPIMHHFRGEGGGGEPLSQAGGKVATVAPWHRIFHHVHRLCGTWQGGQAMC